MGLLGIILTGYLIAPAWFVAKDRLDGPLWSIEGAQDVLGRVCCCLGYAAIAALMWRGINA